MSDTMLCVSKWEGAGVSGRGWVVGVDKEKWQEYEVLNNKRTAQFPVPVQSYIHSVVYI